MPEKKFSSLGKFVVTPKEFCETYYQNKTALSDPNDSLYERYLKAINADQQMDASAFAHSCGFSKKLDKRTFDAVAAQFRRWNKEKKIPTFMHGLANLVRLGVFKTLEAGGSPYNDRGYFDPEKLSAFDINNPYFDLYSLITAINHVSGSNSVHPQSKNDTARHVTLLGKKIKNEEISQLFLKLINGLIERGLAYPVKKDREMLETKLTLPAGHLFKAFNLMEGRRTDLDQDFPDIVELANAVPIKKNTPEQTQEARMAYRFLRDFSLVFLLIKATYNKQLGYSGLQRGSSTPDISKERAARFKNLLEKAGFSDLFPRSRGGKINQNYYQALIPIPGMHPAYLEQLQLEMRGRIDSALEKTQPKKEVC